MGLRPVILLVALPLCGCVFGAHQVAAPPRAALATPPAAALSTYASPANEYPTVGGNVLAGTSPDVQAAARAAAIRPPTADAP